MPELKHLTLNDLNLDISASGRVESVEYDSTNKKLVQTIDEERTDIVTVATIKTDMGLTKSDVGLGNVDNTSDANKPVSNATQAALDNKKDKQSAVSDPTASGNAIEFIDTISQNAQGVITPTKKTVRTFGGASSDHAGTTGVVPAPSSGSQMYYLRGDGTWQAFSKNTVGLGNVDNTSDANKPVSTATQTALNGKLDTSLKGAANGLAELDASGLIPSSQLPSYVDDVIECASVSDFPATGEAGKIYVALDTDKTYRWGGSTYVEISKSLALGETSSTAYRGDRGKTAYSHATDSGRITTAQAEGLYKISTTNEGHVGSASAVQKSDITALGIPAQDTTYESKTAVSGGTDVSLVTTGEKYGWNEKVSCTEANVKSALGTGTGTALFLREDGTWAAPQGAGTITEVQVNGTSIAQTGVANIPAATPTNYGVVQLGAFTWGDLYAASST